MQNGKLKESTERHVEMSGLYRDLLLSNITEAMKICLHGVLQMVEGHNAIVGPGNYASKQSIISCFQATAEYVEGELNDAFADLIIDLQRAVEEYEDEDEVSHRS